jgi:hypothetical protein
MWYWRHMMGVISSETLAVPTLDAKPAWLG